MHGTKNFLAMLELKIIILMILNQVASAGINIIYKLAVADGMKVHILVVYRLIFATIFITPLALVLERKSRPKFTRKVAFNGFASGLLGAALLNNFYAEGLAYTSATFAATISNIIPALTLLMAVILSKTSFERLDMSRSTGKAKVLGTALSISGAMVLTLYKGKTITPWPTHLDFLHGSRAATRQASMHDHFLGAIFSLLSSIVSSSWLILQTKVSKTYPHFSITALVCFTGAILSGVYSLCREKDWTEWKLGCNIRLLAAAYAGIIGSGFSIVVTSWGTQVRGPLYVSSFSPLALVFVAVVASIILDEQLHLGSMIGSVLIVAGLYFVLWGKSKDKSMVIHGSQVRGDDSQCTTETSPVTAENVRNPNRQFSLYTAER